MTEQQPPSSLLLIIVKDLLSVGKLALCLLALTFTVAIGIVLVTYETRAKITYRDQLLETREELDSEWRNLILEEKALAEHTRIQRLASEDLGMKRPDADKEITVELN